MEKRIEFVNGKPIADFKATIPRIQVLQFCASIIITKYPELAGKDLEVVLNYTKTTWEVSLNGIYEKKDIRSPGNGKNHPVN